MTFRIDQADCLEWLRAMPADSVDLVFGSPPYEKARLYLENGEDLGVARDTETWVAWMVEVAREASRVCRGLVAFVVEGQTRDYRYSCGPALLMADLYRAGFNLRKPPIFHRIGIPGSGGPDWLRNDWEWIVCITRPGKLPWSDNTAHGTTPKWAPGGEMSNRLSDGQRVNGRNQWGGTKSSKGHNRADGSEDNFSRPSHQFGEKIVTRRKANGKRGEPGGTATSGSKDGDTLTVPGHYHPPAIANPGNNIETTYTAAEVADLLNEHADWRHHNVGGGLMGGDVFCSQNEAPFPEALAAFFVQSFCPAGGVVLDCFSGSGTTGAVSIRHGRHFLGCDLRQSMVDLSRLRIEQETPLNLFAEEAP